MQAPVLAAAQFVGGGGGAGSDKDVVDTQNELERDRVQDQLIYFYSMNEIQRPVP